MGRYRASKAAPVGRESLCPRLKPPVHSFVKTYTKNHAWSLDVLLNWSTECCTGRPGRVRARGEVAIFGE